MSDEFPIHNSQTVNLTNHWFLADILARKRLRTPVNRRCGCGVHHLYLPKDAQHRMDLDELSGTYWNCGCGSTLFIPSPVSRPLCEICKSVPVCRPGEICGKCAPQEPA